MLLSSLTMSSSAVPVVLLQWVGIMPVSKDHYLTMTIPKQIIMCCLGLRATRVHCHFTPWYCGVTFSLLCTNSFPASAIGSIPSGSKSPCTDDPLCHLYTLCHFTKLVTSSYQSVLVVPNLQRHIQPCMFNNNPLINLVIKLEIRKCILMHNQSEGTDASKQSCRDLGVIYGPSQVDLAAHSMM